jgi:hypothetical protein
VSFDLFVDRFEAGQPVGPSAEGFERVFGPYVTNSEPARGYKRLSFGDDAGADAYFGDGAGMFNHFGGEQFFALLFRYLSETRSVAYWPGKGCSAAVADPGVMHELPPDMIDQLRPALVRSADDLTQIVLG